MSLLSLAKKRIHFHSLHADGVRFRFRHKVTSVAGNERRLLHFPPIEGFSDPPLLVPRPPSDKTKDWTFLLENVEARGVELWFMEYRYTGLADVRGGFELAPGRKLWVGPARLEPTTFRCVPSGTSHESRIGSCAAVVVQTMSAKATVAAAVGSGRASSPSSSRTRRANAAARSEDRPQTVTRSIGRTWRRACTCVHACSP